MRVIENSKEMIKQIYKIKLPKEETYCLQNQMRRAAISVLLNIREGNVFIDKRKITHFERSLGSMEEVIACLDLVESLYNQNVKYQQEISFMISNQLKALIKSIR